MAWETNRPAAVLWAGRIVAGSRSPRNRRIPVIRDSVFGSRARRSSIATADTAASLEYGLAFERTECPVLHRRAPDFGLARGRAAPGVVFTA
uniref:Uncharacterized protein n=1 Tax=Haloferax volcanii (strain ATCC 29605 / DSM 3757 / JCM 8879 / NBRC 14742 / NCIMB 2012 / VKM B-1768 / DS2) TaxID=309800 RepID=D4GRI8_HALVD